MIFHATAADVAVGVTVTGKYATISDVVFTNSGAGKNWLSLALVGASANVADGLTFDRCHWVDPDLSTESVVDVDGDIDSLTVRDGYVVLGVNAALSSLVEVANGADTTEIDLDGNFVNRLVAASAVQLANYGNTTTTNTGVMRNNLCATRDTGGALYATAAIEVHISNCLSTAAVDASGFIENADS